MRTHDLEGDLVTEFERIFDSPCHAGEREIQRRLGVREELETRTGRLLYVKCDGLADLRSG